MVHDCEARTDGVHWRVYCGSCHWWWGRVRDIARAGDVAERHRVTGQFPQPDWEAQ